jgi:hypothetical protein
VGIEKFSTLLVESVVGGEVEARVLRGAELEPPHLSMSIDECGSREIVTNTERLKHACRVCEVDASSRQRETW